MHWAEQQRWEFGSWRCLLGWFGGAHALVHIHKMSSVFRMTLISFSCRCILNTAVKLLPIRRERAAPDNQKERASGKAKSTIHTYFLPNIKCGGNIQRVAQIGKNSHRHFYQHAHQSVRSVFLTSFSSPRLFSYVLLRSAVLSLRRCIIIDDEPTFSPRPLKCCHLAGTASYFITLRILRYNHKRAPLRNFFFHTQHVKPRCDVDGSHWNILY
jgi:hypothetical protein